MTGSESRPIQANTNARGSQIYTPDGATL